MVFKSYCGKKFPTYEQRAQHAGVKDCKKKTQQKPPKKKFQPKPLKKKPQQKRLKKKPQQKPPKKKLQPKPPKKKFQPKPPKKKPQQKHIAFRCHICGVNYLSPKELFLHQTEKNFFKVGKSHCARLIDARVREQLNKLK